MYEELDFGDLTAATRTTDDGTETLTDATITVDRDGVNGPELHIKNIGEGPLNHVYVDLLTGDLDQRRDKRSNPRFSYDDANIDVSDGEMSITIDRGFETLALVIECEGELTDETGVDLEDLGIDL